MRDWLTAIGVGPIVAALIALVGLAFFGGAAVQNTTSVLGGGTQTVTATVTETVTATVTETVTTGPSGPVDAGVYHHGTLVLPNQEAADLDSPPDVFQWDAGATDIYIPIGDDLSSDVNSQILFAKDNGGDYCQTSSGYADVSLPRKSLKPGYFVCVRTDEGRFSRLKITNVTADAVTFTVDTFKLPSDP